MAVAAETVRFEIVEDATEKINRRTDDIIFNVRYLQENIVDRSTEAFASHAEADVLEQNITEIAEADVHAYGPIVEQHRDAETGQYVSLGTGTVDNAKLGYEAIDQSDEKSLFEAHRRVEEVIEEAMILQPATNWHMRNGATKIMISPEPTPEEADLDVAQSFGYDGRTMLRIQRLSSDGEVKTMQSFSLFDVTAKTWAQYFSAKYGVEIEPTALAVMQITNQTLLQHGSTPELLKEFIGGVMEYVDEAEKDSIQRQLDSFLLDQDELKDQAEYYAQEKLEFQKELALCLGDYARPKVAAMLYDALPRLNEDDQHELSKRLIGSVIYVDEYVAELAVKIKTLTIDNRAGLATHNHYTVMRVASKIGLEAAIEMAVRERAIQLTGNEVLVRQNELQITASGVGCGGGCAVGVAGMFSEEERIGRQAGLSGTLYTSKELDKGSKCQCVSKKRKAHVISNGKNVVCSNCGDYNVNGVKGTLGLALAA
jgi:hypothetical protein